MLDEKNRRGQVKPLHRQEKREQRQFIAVLVLFVVVSIIIGALYLVQSTTNVTNSRDIQQLRNQRNRMLRDNEALRAQNAELMSVSSLMDRASALGFREAGPQDMQFIVIEGYSYAQPAPTLTPVAITPTPLVYEDNFAGWVRQQLDELSAMFQRWGQQ